jgi:hypothetical protein
MVTEPQWVSRDMAQTSRLLSNFTEIADLPIGLLLYFKGKTGVGLSHLHVLSFAFPPNSNFDFCWVLGEVLIRFYP